MAAIAVGRALPSKIETYLFYEADRYDLHGKDILRSNPKEYIADLGIRSYLGGYKSTDMGRLFENAVYLQLLYKGWRVHVGKLYSKEVDFVVVKDGRAVYLQVTDQMLSEGTWKRELKGPLRSIHDSYERNASSFARAGTNRMPKESESSRRGTSLLGICFDA